MWVKTAGCASRLLSSKSLVFGSALLAFLVVSFPGVFFFGESFSLRDYPIFGLPLADYLGWSLQRGEIPLWNPYSQCGLPFAAQWNTMVFYPGSWVFALIAPLRALSLFCVLHVFLAGMGMHWLVHRITRCEWGAAAAGFTYAGQGLMMTSLMWPNNVAAFGWFPWVFGLTLHASQNGGRAIGAAALATAVQMLSGAPEVILFGWGVIGTTILFSDMSPGTNLPLRSKRLAAVILLATLLSAIQLLPFYELLTNSGRMTTGGTGNWSATWAAFLRWVMPLFNTFAMPAGPRYHIEQAWSHSFYTGLLPLLVLGAAWRANHPRLVRNLLALSAFAGLLALKGSNSLFDLAAGWLPMRYPVKLLIVHAFTFPLLLGVGIATVRYQADKDGNLKAQLGIGSGLVLLLLLISAGVLITAEQEAEKSATAWFSLGSRALIGATLLAALIGFSRAKGNRLTIVCGILVISLSLIDLMTHQRDLSPTVKRNVMTGFSDQIRQHAEQLGHNATTRVALTARARYHTVFGVPGSMEEQLQNRASALAGNINLMGRIANTQGFYSLDLRSVTDIIELLYTGPNTMHPGIIRAMAVTHLITHGSVFSLVPIDDPSPMLCIGAQPIFHKSGELVSLLQQPDYTPERKALFHNVLRGEISAQASPSARIEEIEFSPQRIAFDTYSETRTIVVLSQAWYPNWQATVTGKNTSVWPVNGAFMAIEVPAGSHKVEFQYVDTNYEIGRAVSCLALIGTLLLLLRPSKNDDAKEITSLPRQSGRE